MRLRDFLKSGHWPTLLSAFFYFDVSFMVWILIGALANAIVADLDLSAAEKGLLVATPILGGALLRLPFGIMTDLWGGRRVGLFALSLTTMPLLFGWLWADSFSKLLIVGLFLGVAGASFAVALPLASRWYPPQHQGLALGITGAGNSGTALATFFAPRLAEVYGWHAVFGLALLPITIAFIILVVFARDCERRTPPIMLKNYLELLRDPDAWRFCFLYAVTFGGFVGLASFLNVFLHDQYSLHRVTAGNLATLCVLAGSLLRPLGGYLADRMGGMRLLAILLSGVTVLTLGVAGLPPLPIAGTLLVMIMGLLGLGNGAVFQVVPQRFPRQVGVVTGLVGAIGGLGGFVLPTVLGGMKSLTSSYAGGFIVFASAAVLAYVLLRRLQIPVPQAIPQGAEPTG
ncbi:MAG: NarK/NasA family nitrate transporter [Gemmatales bacterium]|nr:NarK/NasA family nitrate transporter [Gemmatales bacterium]MDW8387898.1 nitrate/nitrite transporter [Gemmatales bacterium]